MSRDLSQPSRTMGGFANVTATALVALTAWAANAGDAIAGEKIPAQQAGYQEDEIATLKALLAEQQRQLDLQKRQIEYLQQSLTEVRQAQASGSFAKPDAQLPVVYNIPAPIARPSEKQDQVVSAGYSTQAPDVQTLRPKVQPAAEQAGQRETVGERPPEEKKAPPELPAIADVGGVTTPQGVLTIEPSFTASHSSSSRFLFRGVEILPSFLIGVIEVNQAERDFLSAGLGVRYGITNRLEGSVSIPYVYRNDNIQQSGASLGGNSDTRDIEGHGIGDLEAGLQYQINKGTHGWPIIAANMRVKIPTGTGPFDVPRDTRGLELELPTGSGFLGLQPSITLIKQMDPLVFYLNASYLMNRSKSINQVIPTTSGTASIARVNPGDAIGVAFGGAFGITENVSVSMGYEHYYVFGTKQQASSFDDATDTFGPLATFKSESAQVGTLTFGVNFKTNSGGSWSVSLATGLTDEAPDVQIALRRPFSVGLGR